MNRKWFSNTAFKLLRVMVFFGLLVMNLGLYSPGWTNTQSPIENTVLTLIVTNTNMEENAPHGDPLGLLTDPGPDGISYAEAVHSVGGPYDQSVRITFDPSLSGAIIDTSQGFNSAILADNVTIDGDLDDDGDPDITLIGNNADGNGIWIWAASHVLIEGLILRYFGWGGIRITNNVEEPEFKVFEDIVIRNNRITDTGYKGAIDIVLENVDYGSIRGIEIVGNTILDDSSGVNIEAGWGGGSDNEISHVSLISNTITGGVAIRAAGGFHSGTSRNTVSDVVIQGNQISNDAILLDAANREGCNDNTIRDVVIANNHMDVSPVTIEIVSVGGTGWESTGNRVENMIITDNVLTGGGIQIGGANAGDAYNNTISEIVIDRNNITSCAANGIMLIAGDNGAHHNLIENTVIRNTLVANSSGAGVLLHGEDNYSPNNTIRGVAISNLTLVNNGIGTAWAGGLNINSQYLGNIISGVTVSNTILWGNNFDDAIRGSLVPDRVAYSILNDARFTGSDGNNYQSPEFVDPVSGDYRLKAGSPGVDTGDPSAANIGPQDLDKKLRLWDGDGDTHAVVDRGAWEYSAILPQEIDVLGNDFSIFNGDTLPGYWDGTDFGVASITGGKVEHTFTVQNTGSLTLTLSGEPMVTITGTHAADFSVLLQPQTPVAPGEATTFTITFDPSSLGLRNAVVSIANDDSDESPYTFAIKGTGISQVNKIYIPFIQR